MKNSGQLRLVFRNSRTNLNRCESLLPLPKKRPVASRVTPLGMKIQRLESSNRAAAAVVERLVDDLLDDLPKWMPPLE